MAQVHPALRVRKILPGRVELGPPGGLQVQGLGLSWGRCFKVPQKTWGVKRLGAARGPHVSGEAPRLTPIRSPHGGSPPWLKPWEESEVFCDCRATERF